MLTKSCSVNEVIARIIRNTRINDVSYIQDMIEWIPEAMGMMRTSFQLSPAFQDVIIDFHKGKLPCGLINVVAVEYNGRRLPYGNSVKHYQSGHSLKDTADQVTSFISTTVTEPNQYSNENSLFWRPNIISETELSTACNLPMLSNAWYQLEMDWLNTSIREGVVRVYFQMQPIDEEGLPLIPDNEDYKQALYYYVRAMMFGAGYEDKLFNYEQLMQHFELHAARAMGQIQLMSPDMKETQLKTQLRFIPPANYWENFFKTDSYEQIY